jgi:WD40 repeat protein
MQQFHEPIRQSAAHLYISAIPLLPSSVLFKTYANTLHDIPKLISGAVTPAAVISLQGETAFSPDRCRFIIANSNNTLSIWNVGHCSPIGKPLVGHDKPISRIQFSDDGTKFCSLDSGGRVLMWDAIAYQAIGAPLQHSNTYGRIFEIDFVDDSVVGFAGDERHWFGARSVAASSDRVCCWEIATGNLVASYELGIDEFVHVQGAFLVWTAEVKHVTKIVNAITGEDVTYKYTHGQVIQSLEVSPDKMSMACRYDDYVIRISDVHSGNIVGDPIMFDFDCMSFSANGRRLVVARTRDVAIYDVETGKLLYGPLEWAYDESYIKPAGVELSRDETRLVVWTRDGSFRVLDVQCAKVIAPVTRGNLWDCNWCAMSFDGTSIVRYDGWEVTVFDVNLLPAPHCGDDHIISITSSPTGEQLLFTFSNNNLWLSDANANMDVSFSFLLDGARPPAAFSIDGSTVVSAACTDHTLLLWNSKNGEKTGKPLQGHHSTVTAVAFSPGCRLISASAGGTIFIWDVSSGVGDLLQAQISFDVIQLISLSRDESRIICTSESGVIQTLDAKTGVAISSPSVHDDWHWAAFSPDGNRITSLSKGGRWRSIDGWMGRIIEDSILRHTQGIQEAAFSPNRMHFISACTSDTIDFSDVIPSSPSDALLPGGCSNTTKSMAFSPDGTWMVSLHRFDVEHHTIRMWDSESGMLIREVVESGDVWQALVAISHSGSRVLTYSDGSFEVRDASLREIASYSQKRSLAERPESVAFSEDDSQMIYTLKSSGTVETWDIESGIMISCSVDADLEPGGSETFVY